MEDTGFDTPTDADTIIARVLVVEDDTRLATLLQRQLEAAGFEVQTAERGATALAVVESHLPDLVVLDLRLPDMSGYELCWTLRQMYDRARLPIVIVTGVEQDTEALRHEAEGADAYLRKPYYTEDLIQTIRSLLHR